jgi:hypothetical protein
MSHVISKHRSDDPRQTAVSDLTKVVSRLVVPRFEQVRAERLNHSGIAAKRNESLIPAMILVDFI